MADGIEVQGTDKLRATLENMGRQLRTLPAAIDQEFFNWQAEEVHRAHPSVHRRGKRTMWSLFRPHSLREMQRAGKQIRRAERFKAYVAKHPRSRRRPPRVYRRTSTRPILRAELLDALQLRIANLIARVQWR